LRGGDNDPKAHDSKHMIQRQKSALLKREARFLLVWREVHRDQNVA
jgi:hypothetical protein